LAEEEIHRKLPQDSGSDYCDKHGNAIRPKIIEDCNQHMGYVDKSERMANSYSISRRTFKWTKKLFFHLIDLTIMNTVVLQGKILAPGLSTYSY
jgi:hypothetical protein